MVEGNKNHYAPSEVSPPGETLREILAERGMTQADLAERTGRPKKTINEIIKGKTAITTETALQFEMVLGVPANFWNRRELHYREYLEAREERARLEKHSKWVKRFPVAAMARRGWIEKHGDKAAQLKELLQFFGVASPEQWEAVYARQQVAFRRSAKFKPDQAAMAAWLRQGVRQAEALACKPYSKRRFLKTLREVRRLTRQGPEAFVPALGRLCAEAGVAVVFVPEMRGSRASGATRWLMPGKAMIQLSLRYKTDDHLWFTLFHESAHILLHGKRAIFIEGAEAHGQEEEEADRFAADSLIPPEQFKAIARRSRFSLGDLRSLARQLGIAPGILVGRLQHEGLLPQTHGNRLKQRLEWAA
ncbi:MAG: helix-turn-helix domain-containing protein [Candidatus Eisenbacteria sp.]|nr:helix-turn-helix domain-containing protein [Candidatus Eisenbacteria bacterium]